MSERGQQKQQVTDALQRRPSFWKTPLPRNNPLSVSGTKRHYSQIINDASHTNNTHNNCKANNAILNPNKKRRLLTAKEIEDIAKFGGLNPSHIIIAVQESDGFCWFKRKNPMNNNFDKDSYLRKYWNINNKPSSNASNPSNDNALRELTKEELTKRSAAAAATATATTTTATAAASADTEEKTAAVTMNEGRQKAMQKAAKLRRHTLPLEVLSKMVKANDEKEKQLMGRHRNHQKKRKKKKKMKKVIQYKTQKEIVRKKVKKLKRIVYKKKARNIQIKITTEFENIDIPDFPIPGLKLNVLFACAVHEPWSAVKNFEIALIESLVMPLTAVYGQNNNLSFMTRNVLQFLMELKKQIDSIVDSMEIEVLCLAVQRGIALKEKENENKEITQTSNVTPMETSEKDRDGATAVVLRKDQRSMSEEHEQQQGELDEEYAFYEQHLMMFDDFCAEIDQEIEFTENALQEIQSEEHLQRIFDFEAINENENGCPLVLDDETFMERIAADIDRAHSEYAMDLMQILSDQSIREQQMTERDRNNMELFKYYTKEQTQANEVNETMDDKDTTQALNKLMEGEKKKFTLKSLKVVDYKQDRMAFANFFKTNKDNDYDEDDNGGIKYLRQLDGYEMREDDTMHMDVQIH